jgi:dethiobiotin synthetase
MKRIFITGTDTDCGKTYVLCQWLASLHQQNRKAIGLKPVASGCVESKGQLINDDAVRIQQANSHDLAICQWKFCPPIAPHIAAEKVGQSMSAKQIAQFCADKSFSAYESILIEGAGGLMAPLNYTETWIDFIKEAQLEVLLVVGMRLGCINHALLTASVLKQHSIRCLGWVANCIDPTMQVLPENIATLQRTMPIPYLATVSYQGQLLGL